MVERAMSESPDGDTWSVVPFERVGPIELGASKREVIRLLKEEPFYTSERAGITTEVFRDAGADVEFDQQDRVLGVIARSSVVLAQFDAILLSERTEAEVVLDLEALGYTVHRSEGGVVVPDLGLRCFIEEGVVTGVMGVRRDYDEEAADAQLPQEPDEDE
jgi:hypothetical protein